MPASVVADTMDGSFEALEPLEAAAEISLPSAEELAQAPARPPEIATITEAPDDGGDFGTRPRSRCCSA